MPDDLFADLDPQSPTLSRWKKTQRLGEHEVPFVLQADGAAPTREALASVARVWAELPSFDARARTFLLESTLDEGSPAAEYVEYHVDGLRFEVLTELFGDTDDLEIGTFLEALQLVRVALLPNERTAVLDYSLGLAITNSVLAVSVALSAGAERWSVGIAASTSAD